MSLADYQQFVSRLVPDESGHIADADRDAAIEVARLRYSADLPRDLVEDIAWAAAGYYNDLPPGWTDASQLVEAESPPDLVPPALIDLALYVDATGPRLAAPYSLDAGTAVRVRFSAEHLLQAVPVAADTIPLEHREAVASYAAHLLCKQLATRYSGERETSIAADGSNTESRARNYAHRAKDYRATYYAGIGRPDPMLAVTNPPAGSGVQPASGSSAWPGRRRGLLVPTPGELR